MGTAIGVVVGVLMAPKEGSETRETVKKYAQPLAQDTVKNVKKVVEASTPVVEQIVSKTSPAVSHIFDNVNSNVKKITFKTDFFRGNNNI